VKVKEIISIFFVFIAVRNGQMDDNKIFQVADVGQASDFPKNSGAIGICMLIFTVTNLPYLNIHFAYLAYLKKVIIVVMLGKTKLDPVRNEIYHCNIFASIRQKK
jgi:hypothetical protein